MQSLISQYKSLALQCIGNDRDVGFTLDSCEKGCHGLNPMRLRNDLRDVLSAPQAFFCVPAKLTCKYSQCSVCEQSWLPEIANSKLETRDIRESRQIYIADFMGRTSVAVPA